MRLKVDFGVSETNLRINPVPKGLQAFFSPANHFLFRATLDDKVTHEHINPGSSNARFFM